MLTWYHNPTSDWLWTCNGRLYLNKVDAVEQSIASKKPVRFLVPNCYDDHNWNMTPRLPWQTLIKNRATEIREKYKYIRLWFSGGVDSRTVLDCFIENDIFIDEIATSRSGFKEADYEIYDYAIPYLQKIKHKLNTKTKINMYETEMKTYHQVYKDDKWLLNPMKTAHRHYFRLIHQAHYFFRKNEKETIDLIGHDKPQVIHINGKWYTFFQDSRVEPVYGWEGKHLGFFTDDPMVHHSQCVSLIQAIEQHVPKNKWNTYWNISGEKQNFIIEHTHRNTNRLIFPKKFHNVFDATTQKTFFNRKEMLAAKQIKKMDPKLYERYLRNLEEFWQGKEQYLNNNDYRNTPLGCLSKFYCLTDGSIKTVDELFPNGFNPPKS